MDDRGEVVVGQNHVRGLLGHVRAGNAHGNADVRLLKRRRVVHTVSGDGHDLAHLLQVLDDAQLLLRRHASEDNLALQCLFELLV